MVLNERGDGLENHSVARTVEAVRCKLFHSPVHTGGLQEHRSQHSLFSLKRLWRHITAHHGTQRSGALPFFFLTALFCSGINHTFEADESLGLLVVEILIDYDTSAVLADYELVV